jgi:GAF domain-containing protein
LGTIASSPGKLDPVFKALLAKAVRICSAKMGILFLFENGAFRTAAMHGVPRKLVEERRRKPVIDAAPNTALGRIAATKRPVQIADVQASPAYRGNAIRRAGIIGAGGARTLISVPMLKESELIGSISVYRKEVLPFTEKQIALLSNFASQAVIAIENTRLLNELREALQQQTATSQVLRVISSSPGDLEPVFEAMLKNATRICDAKFGVLHRYQDGAFHTAAQVGVPPELAAYHRKRGPYVPPPEMPLGSILRTKKVLHTVDQAAARFQPPSAKLAGARTHIAVPMLKEGEVMGAITIYRTEVRPFTDKQIALLQNFAAQAVIAIENTRLLNELRWRTDDLSEALGQQMATSEVLGVIARSSGKLEPVFQTLLANALRICDAKFGAMFRFEGEENYPVAELNSPPALKEWLMQRGRRRSPAGQSLHSVWKTKQVCHITDDVTSDNPSPPARLAGARTHLAVPMLKDDELIGAIVIYRQEVRSFTEKQIDLLKNFASQAVIAIENTRLLNELRQSLEQQTATADVLRVISRSTFDLQTVLDTLVESAARLCHADRASIRAEKEDGLYHNVASSGYSPSQIEWLKQNPFKPDRTTAVGHVMLDGRMIHIEDTLTDPGHFHAKRVEVLKVRTLLSVPLLREVSRLVP